MPQTGPEGKVAALRVERGAGALPLLTGDDAMKETKGKPKKETAPKPNASNPSVKGLAPAPAAGKKK